MLNANNGSITISKRSKAKTTIIWLMIVRIGIITPPIVSLTSDKILFPKSALCRLRNQE